MIIMTVAALLTHISASYGLVDATKIVKEEQKVPLIVWNLNDPPVLVYNTVRELVALAISGNVTNTQTQIYHYRCGNDTKDSVFRNRSQIMVRASSY